jgi:hypothetical protein
MFRRRRAVPDDEVATRQPLGGGVTRWLLAAPSRPGSGPFGLHLGLGGPGLGVAVLPPVVGGVARTGDGLDGDMLTAARRRELHEPAGSAGQRAWFASVAASGRLPPLAVEVVPSCVCAVRLIPAPGCLFRFYRSRYVGHGEMAVVIARSWWRELVGGEFGGARWSIGAVVFWGLGEIPVGWPTPTR